MWPELKIVHGKPRHSQSQGYIERVNQDREKMLCTWLEFNKTTKWSERLRFIQFMKSRAYHAGISRSPHEAMFRCKAKTGINNCFPQDMLIELLIKEELDNIFNQDENQASEDREIETNEYEIDEEMKIETTISNTDLCNENLTEG